MTLEDLVTELHAAAQAATDDGRDPRALAVYFEGIGHSVDRAEYVPDYQPMGEVAHPAIVVTMSW